MMPGCSHLGDLGPGGGLSQRALAVQEPERGLCVCVIGRQRSGLLQHTDAGVGDLEPLEAADLVHPAAQAADHQVTDGLVGARLGLGIGLELDLTQVPLHGLVEITRLPVDTGHDADDLGIAGLLVQLALPVGQGAVVVAGVVPHPRQQRHDLLLGRMHLEIGEEVLGSLLGQGDVLGILETGPEHLLVREPGVEMSCIEVRGQRQGFLEHRRSLGEFPALVLLVPLLHRAAGVDLLAASPPEPEPEGSDEKYRGPTPWPGHLLILVRAHRARHYIQKPPATTTGRRTYVLPITDRGAPVHLCPSQCLSVQGPWVWLCGASTWICSADGNRAVHRRRRKGSVRVCPTTSPAPGISRVTSFMRCITQARTSPATGSSRSRVEA